MIHSKEQSARKPSKNICRVVGCNNVAGEAKYKGLCFQHRGILQKAPSSKPIQARRNQQKPKGKKSEHQKWKAKLDSVFSVFIRLRDTDKNGFGRCISNGINIYYFVDSNGEIVKNCDNGHFENRSKMSLRFDEQNCNAQSIKENQYNEGNKTAYRNGLIEKYGLNAVLRIEKAVHLKRKYSAFEFQELYNHYESEVSRLLKTKSWWHGQRTQKSLYK